MNHASSSRSPLASFPSHASLSFSEDSLAYSSWYLLFLLLFSAEGHFPHLFSCSLSDYFPGRLPGDLQRTTVEVRMVTFTSTTRIKSTKNNSHWMPFWSLHFFPHINKNYKKTDIIFFRKLHHSLNYLTYTNIGTENWGHSVGAEY